MTSALRKVSSVSAPRHRTCHAGAGRRHFRREAIDRVTSFVRMGSLVQIQFASSGAVAQPGRAHTFPGRQTSSRLLNSAPRRTILILRPPFNGARPGSIPAVGVVSRSRSKSSVCQAHSGANVSGYFLSKSGLKNRNHARACSTQNDTIHGMPFCNHRRGDSRELLRREIGKHTYLKHKGFPVRVRAN